MRIALCIALVLSTCAATGESGPETSPRDVRDIIAALRRQAAQAEEHGDLESARRMIEANLALQPGHTGLAAKRAALAAAQGDRGAVNASLALIAGSGATLDVEALRARLERPPDPEAELAFARIAGNAKPVGRVKTIAVIGNTDLLIEGVAVAEGGGLFAGAVAGRRILYRKPGARAFSVFADDADGLQGVFGLAIDRKRNILWAATGAQDPTPLKEGETGRGALIGFDLASGRPVARLEAPEGIKALSDFTLASDGTLYVSDQENRRVLRADGPNGKLSVFAQSPQFVSLQGMTIRRGALYVSDYARGLFRIDLETGAVQAVRVAEHINLLGGDGLLTVGDDLLMIQNGIAPYRVLRVTLNADGRAVTRTRTLAAGLEEFHDPTLGQVVDGKLIFIANSQWPLFSRKGGAKDRKPTRIVALDLDDPEHR